MMDNLEIADIDLEDIEYNEFDLFELPPDYQETQEQIEADQQGQEEKDKCERLFANAEITKQNKEKKFAKMQEKLARLNNFIL
jgi:tartrate dehydratase alpha subunit/fumarate hydratase class I-like protein